MNEIVFDVENIEMDIWLAYQPFTNKCAIIEQGALMLRISSTWNNWSDRDSFKQKQKQKLRSIINSICLMLCKIIQQ